MSNPVFKTEEFFCPAINDIAIITLEYTTIPVRGNLLVNYKCSQVSSCPLTKKSGKSSYPPSKEKCHFGSKRQMYEPL